MAPDEFATIAEVFAPLSDGEHGLGLRDDGARLRFTPGFDIIATADQIVAGRHFTGAESAGEIARKALRVNLSDLAAMGAAPRFYLLTIALPDGYEGAWLRAFADALAEEQRTYGVVLVGGDTVRTDGPLVISITAMGEARIGAALRRSGAASGDIIYVSGTIGDAVLGLRLDQGGLAGAAEGTISEADADWLRQRYRLPQPRCALGSGLVGYASAAIDVSDGLVADLGHLCSASGSGAAIEAARIPLSQPARALVAARPDLLNLALTGGDDYELLFTAHPDLAPAIDRLSTGFGLALTSIGKMTAGSDVAVREANGKPMQFATPGYTHF